MTLGCAAISDAAIADVGGIRASSGFSHSEQKGTVGGSGGGYTKDDLAWMENAYRKAQGPPVVPPVVPAHEPAHATITAADKLIVDSLLGTMSESALTWQEISANVRMQVQDQIAAWERSQHGRKAAADSLVQPLVGGIGQPLSRWAMPVSTPAIAVAQQQVPFTWTWPTVWLIAAAGVGLWHLMGDPKTQAALRTYAVPALLGAGVVIGTMWWNRQDLTIAPAPAPAQPARLMMV